jgi:hypothetical protein
MATSLPVFPPFDVHLDSNAGPRWTKWLTRFERLIVGMNITDATQKRALLLHYAGPDVDDIFETLPDTGEDKDYKKAVECLNAYFVPKVNTIYEEYQFRQAKQRSNESLASYHTRLRQLAKHCGFTDVDKEIRTQIVFSCTSHKLRLRALREDLSLTALLEAGRVNEITDQQARDIQPTSTDQNVNALPSLSKPYPVHPDQHVPPQPSYQQRTPTQSLCRNCGGQYPHVISCPANGKTCRSCGKKGHFAKVCRSRPQHRFVQHIADDPEQDPAYTFVLHSEQTVLIRSTPPPLSILHRSHW